MAAVLIVAGGAVLAARLLGGSDAGPGPTGAGDGPPPATLTINGKTVHRQGATPISSLQATDLRTTTLRLLAGSENPTVPNPCQGWTDVRIVGQDDRTITLAATLYVDRSGGPEVLCTAIGRPPGRFTLHLADPLGTRRIVQDGRELRVLLTDTLLHATVLPDGYAAEPRVIEEEATFPGRTRTLHSGPDRNTSLEIDEGPVDQPPTDPRRTSTVEVLDRLTVRAHPAVFRQDRGFDDNRCLVWAETADTGVAVCSLGSPAPLTAAQLATVAEGLVRGR